MPKWHIGPSVDRISLLQTKLTLHYGLDNQVIRIPPVKCVEAVECGACITEAEDLNASWAVTRQSCKATVPTLVRQTVNLRRQASPSCRAYIAFLKSHLKLGCPEKCVVPSNNPESISLQHKNENSRGFLACSNLCRLLLPPRLSERTSSNPTELLTLLVPLVEKLFREPTTAEILHYPCHRPHHFNAFLKHELRNRFFALDQQLCEILAKRRSTMFRA